MNGRCSRMGTKILRLLAFTLFIILLPACAPAASPPEQAVVETAITTVEVRPNQPPQRRPLLNCQPAADAHSNPHQPAVRGRDSTAIATFPSPPTQPHLPTPTAKIEERAVEVEWPSAMRLGESDVVRMALVPTSGGYTLTTEFPEHQTITQTIQLQRPGGYELFAVARLDGVGFDLALEATRYSMCRQINR